MCAADEEQLSLFDDDEEIEDEDPWRCVARDAMRSIELAHQMIDKYWPHIPQGALADRILGIKKSLDGGGF